MVGECVGLVFVQLEGMEHTNKLTKKELNILNEEQIKSLKRLACQTIVNCTVSVSWNKKK